MVKQRFLLHKLQLFISVEMGIRQAERGRSTGMSSLLRVHCVGPFLKGLPPLTAAAKQTVRPIHTSSPNGDFMSWFKRKKQEEHKEPVKDTKQLIKDIEEGRAGASSKNKNRLELIPDNFIGDGPRRYKRKKELKHAISAAPFNQWLTRGKVTSENELDDVISQAMQKTLGNDDQNVQFPDLVAKFEFTKFLQAKSGYLISDYKLTTLTTPYSSKSILWRKFYHRLTILHLFSKKLSLMPSIHFPTIMLRQTFMSLTISLPKSKKLNMILL